MPIVARYLRERLDVHLSVDRSKVVSDEMVSVSLTLSSLQSSPIAEVYDYPLTLIIDVPPDWGEVRVEQSGKVEVVTASGGVVQFDAIPDGGAIHLNKLASAPCPGDFDMDGDVDQADFGHLQACLSGEDVAVTDPACFAARLDTGDDADQHDVQIFMGCMSGPNSLADRHCAD